MHTSRKNNEIIASISGETLHESVILLERSLYAKSIDLLKHSQLTANIAHFMSAHSGGDFGCTPEDAFIAGLIHDVGKIYITDAVLDKNDVVSEREWEVIQRHPLWGKEYVKGTVLEQYTEPIENHHERPDGRGYPKGLSGKSISDFARLISFSDRLAAFLDDRPYRRRVTDFTKVCEEIRANTRVYFQGELGEKTKLCALKYASDWLQHHKTPLMVSSTYNNDSGSVNKRTPCEFVSLEGPGCGGTELCKTLVVDRGIGELAEVVSVRA